MPPSQEPASSQEPLLPDLPPVPGVAGGPAAATASVQVEFDGDAADLSAKVSMGAGPAPPPVAKPVATDDQPNGRSFGGYALERKIGQGGMGQVWKARQVSLDRVVAIKILNKALDANEEFIRRFQREAKSIARINHPNIVAVYDFGQQDGQWYMVNEFIEGASLAKLMADKLVVPPAELIPLMCHCLAGLQHVASMGIVHRDIKPDNILITLDGIAKIADFGLAKETGEKDKQENTDLTGAGLAMGTPSYMSPEQCVGRKLDSRSDIYALGVTAYFALTGSKPFTGNSSFEIMTRHREHHPAPPSQLNPGIPAELSDVVMRMLAKDPADRHRDPEDCRQAWLTVGRSLGLMGGVFDVGSERRSARMSSVAPAPAAPTDPLALQPPPLPLTTGRTPTPLPTTPAPPPPRKSASSPMLPAIGPSAAPPPERPTVADPLPRIGSERTSRSGDRKAAGSGTSIGEARTCQRCGMLNRGDAAACARCGTSFIAAGTDRTSQEADAQRLMDQGRLLDAANAWGRMAEAEPDKRNRSILRSKEREARRLLQEQQVGELLTRAKGLAGRGDAKGAIAMLETARAGLDPATHPSIDAASSELRSLAGRRRRILLAFIIAVALVAAGVGAYLALGRP